MPANPTGPPTLEGLLQRWEDAYTAFTSPFWQVETPPDAMKTLRQCIDELRAAIIARHAPGAEGWVSVEERLPELEITYRMNDQEWKGSGRVLCWAWIGYDTWGTLSGKYSTKDGWKVDGLVGDHHEVTHWSALPAPPACESKGERELRTLTAELIVEREVAVSVPDDLQIEMVGGEPMIVQPGSGVTGPKIMLSPTMALNRGLLTLAQEAPDERR